MRAVLVSSQGTRSAKVICGWVAVLTVAAVLMGQSTVSGCRCAPTRQPGPTSTATANPESPSPVTPVPTPPTPDDGSIVVENAGTDRPSPTSGGEPAAPIMQRWHRLALLVGDFEVAAYEHMPGGFPEGRYPILVTVTDGRVTRCQSRGRPPDLFGEAVCGAVSELRSVNHPEGTVKAVAVLTESVRQEP